MRKIILTVLLAALLPSAMMAQGWPENYKGVMLQGFYWDSYDASQWSNLESQADELTQYFSLVWIPQSANCGGKSMGYDDLYWFNDYNSSFGTEAQLRSMISTFKAKGIGTIADVVINHRKNVSNWVDFPAETYKGKTYQLQSTDICRDDDSGATLTWATSNGYSLSSNVDSGEGWSGMRDLDHNSSNVQENVKAYLDFLLNDLGYAGFRYDMVKGYSSKFTGIYNSAANPTYSVGEYWDGDKTKVINWLSGTAVDGKKQSAAFDFPIRYSVRDAANGSNWSKLDNGGLATNNAYKRYAVTFIENHDTEYRSASEQQDPIKKDTLAANAYILAMPGTPCIFMKHWIDCKRDIKNMILLRNLVGINNQSRWSRTESSTSRYVLTTTGTAGKLLAVVGTTASSYSPSSEWALAAAGYHYRYYIEKSNETAWTDLPSGSYDAPATATLYAISATSGAQIVYTTDGSTPTASSKKATSGSKITLPEGDYTLTIGLLIGGKVSGIVQRTYSIKKDTFEPYTIDVNVNVDKAGWKNMNVWSWGGDGSHAPKSAAWPGDAVTTKITANGKSWYHLTYTINSASDYVSFVFNTNSSTQTVDVERVTKTSYFEVQSTTDSQGHYYVNDVTSEITSGIDGIASDNASSNRPTTVVSIDGRTLRTFPTHVSVGVATAGLKSGLYIVNGRKIAVE